MKIAQCLLAALGMLILLSAAGAPATSRFTYQGLLEESNAPANGTFDLRFEPFSAASGGSSLATAIIANNVVVSNGVFTTSLDFGAGFFVGDQVFLDIGVRIGTSSGSFTTLAPRQEITATPYAQTALAVADTGAGSGSSERIGFTDTGIDAPSQSPSVIVGADGFPIISFFDSVNGDLRVAHCTDRACRSSELFTLDQTGIVGEFSSITIRKDGLPVISYYDRSNGNLKLASCLTRSCSTSSSVVVDSGGDVGQYTSIVDGDGTFAPILVFYYDVTNGDLKSVRCSSASCTAPFFAILDSTGNVGQFASAGVGAATGDSAFVWITYYDTTNASMKIVACITFGCGTGGSGTIALTPRAIETGVVAVNSSSIAIGGDNRAWITYNDGTSARIVRCDGITSCSTPSVASLGGIQGHVAATVGIDGVVWVAGRTGGGRVRIGRCEDAASCNAYTTWSATSTGNSQPNPVSAALGVDGIPVVVDGSTDELAIFHCSSATTCTSDVWPR